jgi:hypothetical protein
MTIDWENTITVLTEKWEKLTRGRKPLLVEVATFWLAGKPTRCDVYLSCHQDNREQMKRFGTSQQAQKWLAVQIADMLETEFRRQYALQEQAEMQEVEA